MDRLWHSIILDTRVYADLQDALGLLLVHHRPAGAKRAESVQRTQRLTAMESIYAAFFVKKPIKLTSHPTEPLALDPLPAQPTPPRFPETRATQPITIAIKIPWRSSMKLKTRSTEKIHKLIQSISNSINKPFDSLHLTRRGCPLSPDRTLGYYGIEDGDGLYLHISQIGF